jgi:hypothetical protein
VLHFDFHPFELSHQEKKTSLKKLIKNMNFGNTVVVEVIISLR